MSLNVNNQYTKFINSIFNEIIHMINIKKFKDISQKCY